MAKSTLTCRGPGPDEQVFIGGDVHRWMALQGRDTAQLGGEELVLTF